MKHHLLVPVASLALVLACASEVLAQPSATLTPASGGSAIPADTAGGAYRTLSGPVYQEGGPGDVGPGTIILNAPNGFIFDANASVTVLVNGGTTPGHNINDLANNSTIPATVTASNITITITAKSSNNEKNKLTWQNVRVRPTAGTPLASGNITESGTAGMTGVNGPNGVTNFGTLIEVTGVASTFVVSGFPSPATAGVPGSMTVTAKDQAGNIATNYVGTIHFTSTDPQAVLPNDFTFVAANSGVGTFNNGMTLKTAGTRSIAATDTLNPSVIGTQAPITVNPATADRLVFTTQPGSATYGSVLSSQPLLISRDPYGNDSTVGIGLSKIVGLSVSAGTGLLQGTDALDIGTGAGNGTVSFTNLRIDAAGTGKQLTASAIGLSSAVSDSLDVLPATLTGAITINDKTYDGTTLATIATRSLSGIIGADEVSMAGSTANFADKNAGNNKLVTANGLTLSGAAAANYLLASSTASTTANINQATLTVTAQNKSRVCGAPNPTFTSICGGFAAGEDESVLSGAPSFSTTADATSGVVGNPYSIVVTNGTLSAANYIFTFVNGELTITAAATTNVISSSANPAPTGSNITFTATISALAPSTGTPSGTVQFLADGSPLGSPVSLSAGLATLSIDSLAHGSHVITAEYADQPDFFGSTNSLSAEQVINSAPIAAVDTLDTMENSPASVTAATLMANDTDNDGDALSLTDVSPASAQGGTVSLSAGIISYNPPTDYVGTDSFSYTVSDSFGATAIGTVTVTVRAPVVNNETMLTIALLPDGTAQLSCTAGVPGQAYLIQATSDLGTPSWTTIGTNTAGLDGLVIFMDSDASNYPMRFYRTAIP